MSEKTSNTELLALATVTLLMGIITYLLYKK